MWKKMFVVLVIFFDLTRSFNAWSNSKTFVHAYETFQQWCCLYSYRPEKKQIGMLKPQDFLGKMNPNYTNVYALSILVR